MVDASQYLGNKDLRFLRKKAVSLLMQGEAIHAIAEQRRGSRWWVFPPDGVVVTSHRIILLHCNFFSFKFDDLHWEHVEDVHIREGFLGASIAVVGARRKTGLATQTTTDVTQRLRMNSLVKARAQEVYRIGQEFEHKWRQIVRARAIEEKRAAHGHVVVSAPSSSTPLGPGARLGPKDRLRDLKEMLDEGLISVEDFKAKKLEILGSL